MQASSGRSFPLSGSAETAPAQLPGPPWEQDCAEPLPRGPRLFKPPDPVPLLLADGWEIPEGELQICRHPDGSQVLLGEGRSGKVLKGIRGGVQVRE